MFDDGPQLLEVDHVSKLYSRSPGGTRTRLAATSLRALFGQRARPISTLAKGEFWAVNDLSFRVARGQAIGIIGQNGSGKTTLLRMLSGQILPDKGEIRLRGSAAAMIDLTAGFQGTASGRENIFLRGALLGRSPEQMLAALDEIIDFAELGDAIEAPVMTYSSGMMMRLAFSIMVAVTPDILLVDEILAVGDMRFRQKCHAKIRQIRDRSALVLVSHNMDDVATLCDTVIVMNKGQVVFAGAPEPAIARYLELMEGGQPNAMKLLVPNSRLDRTLRNLVQPASCLQDFVHGWTDQFGTPVDEIESGEEIRFRVSFNLREPIRHLTVGLPVFSEEGVYLTGFASMALVDEPLKAEVGYNCFEIRIEKCPLNAGLYHSVTGVRDGPGYLARVANLPLRVTSKSHHAWGAISVPHEWRRVAPEEK
jgi:lipopolysaccharide transport system ATP-binding protein